MSRTERLLALLQLLRTYRYAVTAEAIARQLGVSVRTVYRDIGTLQAQGASIDGEAGVGYLLKPGFTLPPLMFTVDELEALVLGVSWVARRSDSPLAKAALNLRAKIQAVVPGPLARELEATTLLPGATRPVPAVSAVLTADLRQAVRESRKLEIDYSDRTGQPTRRTIWPFGLGYFEDVLVVMAWCELRQDLRHFRADRIIQWTLRGDGFPRSRQELLADWRQKEGVPETR